jgi:uncharacterized membrane protein YeaQ/YmgE (transglycosylase-associated protein family)
MNIIAWLIIGALAGWLASIIAGTNAQQGWLMNIIVGILGAFVGGFLYSTLFNVPFAAGFDLLTVVVATLGAVLLLLIYRAVSGRSSAV